MIISSLSAITAPCFAAGERVHVLPTLLKVILSHNQDLLRDLNFRQVQAQLQKLAPHVAAWSQQTRIEYLGDETIPDYTRRFDSEFHVGFLTRLLKDVENSGLAIPAETQELLESSFIALLPDELIVWAKSSDSFVERDAFVVVKDPDTEIIQRPLATRLIDLYHKFQALMRGKRSH